MTHPLAKMRYVMGTFLSVYIAGENSEELQRIFLGEVQRLEELLSLYRPESDISRINRAAGTAAVPVSSETFEVVEKSLYYAALSGGAFDPVAPAHLGDYRQVHLDAIARTVFLEAPGMRLDLGGIGKGFALDKALDRIREAGNPESVSADFGGQLLFWHCSGRLGPETIVLEDPRTRDAAVTFQMRSNGSVSTSSTCGASGPCDRPSIRKAGRGSRRRQRDRPNRHRSRSLLDRPPRSGRPRGTGSARNSPRRSSFLRVKKGLRDPESQSFLECVLIERKIIRKVFCWKAAFPMTIWNAW